MERPPSEGRPAESWLGCAVGSHVPTLRTARLTPAAQLAAQRPIVPLPEAARSKQPAAVVTEAISPPFAAVPPGAAASAHAAPAHAAPAEGAQPSAPSTPPAAPPAPAAAGCALLWRLARSFDFRSNALRRPSASRLTGLAARAGTLATGLATGAVTVAADDDVVSRSAVACGVLLRRALSAARLRLTSKDSVRRGSSIRREKS